MEESEFAGKWRVVEAMDFDEDYLSESPDPHIFMTAILKKIVMATCS